MLTDLSFLAPGETWPPASEHERLEMYRNNQKLFECKHAEVYREDLKRIERVIGNFGEVISYPVILNFQKLMSLKVADLLLGEPPRITCGDNDSPEQNSIDAIMANSDLVNTAYMAVIDVSRYGDGLFYIRQGANHGLIDLTQPPIWFPILSPDNVRVVTQHVLAWIVGDKLRVQIHIAGSYEEREYLLDKRTIIRQLSAKVIQTGLTENAIVQVSNVITSDRATGIDDYTDIDSIIAELIVRVGQIARILDKHAGPSMSGPQSALEQDPKTGEWRLKTGNYFPRNDKEDPEVKYITWDGELESNFKQIEKLVNFLYTISEMGSALFGDMSANPGQVPSGSALRRLMIAPLAKVGRIRMRCDPALKKAIALCSQLGGDGIINLSDKPITITWQDGLPGDPVEEANIMQSRTAQKATMSQHRALKQFDGMTDGDADEELARIQDEEASAAPVIAPPFSNGPASAPAGGGNGNA